VTTIHELVAGWVAATPTAVAVRAGRDALTYAELDRRAARVAASLAAAGVRAEDRVGVAIPRSTEAVVTFLGVLRAGAAYVPLDPSYPAERTDFILADSRVTALVTARDVEPTDAARLLPTIVVDSAGLSGAAGPGGPVRPDQCAYVIYTSGSTGTPKGVVVEHRNVVALVANDARLAVAPGQVVAHFAPISFDASVFEIWAALCRGGQVAILPGPQVSVEELGTQLRAVRPDWLFLTTGVFHLLAEFDLAAFKSVGTLLTGGDVLRPAVVAAAAATTRTYAAYGPTETTVYAALHAASPDPLSDRVPLGRALDGEAIRVFGPDLRPAPHGEIGELYIGGAGVSRGYHRKPRLTAERFLPDPFGTVPGARMYRTGDRGRALPGGEVEFHGRIDRQVKVRGFRIEPGEIEHVLLSVPEVSAAAVVAVSGEDGDKRLVAYLTAAGGGDLVLSDLRAAVSARLPAYAVPATFVQLPSLPLDVNGKPDRNALPVPWASRETMPGLPPYQEPRGEVERIIAAAWADALELDRVGVRDEFFALGGDSMRSVVVLERLRSAGLQFTAAEFFTYPTVTELAAAFEAQADASAGQR
jgi:amino acid adenylation domain-containing protein